MPPPAPVPANRILRALSPEDLGLLESDLEAVELPLRMTLENRGKPPEFVYFIDEGIASVVANGYRHRSIEVGLIGREGMTGLAIVSRCGLGGTPHLYATRRSRATSAGIAAPPRHGQKPGDRETDAALCALCSPTRSRTRRSPMAAPRSRNGWRAGCFMAHDRATGNALTLTHEFLAVMLGVRRPALPSPSAYWKSRADPSLARPDRNR
jgi:hypothetical protein